MSRFLMFTLFLIAVMLQGGAYGLTFMLPRLFDGFGADEKTVGAMLMITTVATLLSVYFSGHLSDRLGGLGHCLWPAFPSLPPWCFSAWPLPSVRCLSSPACFSAGDGGLPMR